MQPRPTQTLDADVLDGEPDPDQRTATALQRLGSPAVPATLTELASLRVGDALDVLEARLLILETARKRAIKLTLPEDWLLNKRPDGRVIGYLSDAGCERIRDILGISIFAIGRHEKVVAADGSFMYLIRGSGRSGITEQTVEDVEGGRESTDQFAKGETGAALELKIRKAARANLTGRIVRQLAGLNNVPEDELIDAWQGTKKDATHCSKGHGFGSGDERHGAARAGTPDVPPPVCTVCKGPDSLPLPLLYRQGKAGKKPFYGCRNYDRHPATKVIVDADEHVEQYKKAHGVADAKTTDADIEDAKRQDRELAAKEAKR